jgi:hypothetical protein
MIFITQEVYVFLAANASLRWLDNVSGVYLFQVSSLLIGQQCLGDFFIASHRLEDCANCLPKLEENGKYSAIQAASQSTFINTQ